MCGIFCSFDASKFKELARLNQIRGNHSYSITEMGLSDFGIEIDLQHKEFGNFDPSFVMDVEKGESVYFVGHVQAPTTAIRSLDSVHPAENEYGELLWHNGIIKATDISRLQKKHHSFNQWDTRLLLDELSSINMVDNLSEVDGSFACIYFDGHGLFVFTNELCQLFVDESCNISSLQFPGSTRLPAGQIFEIDFRSKKMVAVESWTFLTKNLPYYFGAT